MATILFMVKTTIPSDKEAAFNRWYNEEHVPYTGKPVNNVVVFEKQ